MDQPLDWIEMILGCVPQMTRDEIIEQAKINEEIYNKKQARKRKQRGTVTRGDS